MVSSWCCETTYKLKIAESKLFVNFVYRIAECWNTRQKDFWNEIFHCKIQDVLGYPWTGKEEKSVSYDQQLIQYFFFCISGRCCFCCCCCRCFTPCKRIRFQNLGNFCLWNPEFQILESGMQLKESRISLTIWIRNPSSADKDSGILYQQSGIHGVEIVLDSFTWSELFWKAKPNEEYHVSVVFHKKAEVRICIYLHMLIC